MRDSPTPFRRLRLAAFVAACALDVLGPLRAQPFPGPGGGAYTWEQVGDRPVGGYALAFRPDGALVSALTTLEVLLPGEAVWQTTELPRTAEALAFLSGGVTLSGSGPIYRSTDGGQTWTRTCDSANGCQGPTFANAFLELPPGHAHAGRVLAGRHLYSDDRGLTWTTAPYDGPADEAFKIAAFAVLPSGRVAAAADGWGLMGSDDGGETWEVSPVYGPFRYAGKGIATTATPGSVQSGAPSCGLADLTLCEGAVALGVDATLPHVRSWWTNDGGRTWTEGTPLPQLVDGVAAGQVGGVFDRGIDPGTGLGRAVAVLGRGFVYVTRDGGQTWAVVGRAPVMDPDTVGKSVRSAVVGPDGRLYVAVVFNGPAREWVYRTVEPVDQAFAVADEPLPAEPPEVGVSVRPNPAGGRVEVAVSLAAAGPVRVVVLDALGREVAVVLDGEVASGERVVGVDTRGWPAGVYVVRAVAGAAVASARLVVVR